MQEFRDEWNERRIDKLEESINILETGVSNEWEHNTTTFKAILEALETIQRITENLDQRVRRLENIKIRNFYSLFNEGGDHMLCSYDVKVGTIGFVEDEKKMLFPTDDEYMEYMREQEEEDHESSSRDHE